MADHAAGGNQRFGARLGHATILAVLVSGYYAFIYLSVSGDLMKPADIAFQLAVGMCLFYGNVYRVFPWAAAKWGRLGPGRVLGILGLELGLFLLLMATISLGTGMLEVRFGHWREAAFVVVNFMAMVYPMVVGLGYSAIYYSRFQLQIDRQRMIDQLLESEQEGHILRQQWMQAQLPTHFLYNALAMLRAMSQAQSPHTGKAYDLMLGILRYGLKTRQRKTIAVEKELKQARRFIAMHDLRHGGRLQVQLHVDGRLHHARIVPMAILVLLENIFVHGDCLDANHPARIRVSYDHRHLSIQAENKIAGASAKSTTGVGLANLRERLAFFFPDRHRFEYGEVGQRFTSILVIGKGANPPSQSQNR